LGEALRWAQRQGRPVVGEVASHANGQTRRPRVAGGRGRRVGVVLTDGEHERLVLMATAAGTRGTDLCRAEPTAVTCSAASVSPMWLIEHDPGRSV